MTKPKTTEAQRAELRALDKAATEGPWFANKVRDGGLTVIDDGRLNGLFDIPAEAQEARLIVAMRNALPALLDDLEAAEALKPPFNLGDRVRVTEAYPFHEWRRVEEIYISGFVVEDDGSVNIWVRCPGEWHTDGFKVTDLELWHE